ncbi:CRISPR-associated helicase Cas3' [Chitinivorax sp. B]|uniref:CRISPR-associated helicase Cas3' n=1 Tax=Chitinivorax sp. B TaxID=2502235 RepID=UPI0010FA5CF6|nr:CRISPR-associated helicase Cas3' [Chitinivorax sp. B]
MLGRDVFTHCRIVGEVAKALLVRFPHTLQQLYPSGAPLVAACHDIGKVSPTFYEKLRRASKSSKLLPLPGVSPELEKQWGGHAGVSQVAAEAIGASRLLAEALGQHHGFRPKADTYRADCEMFGGQNWQAERAHLVAELKSALGLDWPQLDHPSQARLLAGLTSVADWIGSGSLFEDPDQDWQPLIARALDEAGFVPPKLRNELRFVDIFGFNARPLQQAFIDSITEPGVYVLEAPMGQGKTEAALYAAYQMLISGKACGIYFALPTQLTSNKLYERFIPFLEAILQPDCRHRQGLLVHGRAWLMQAAMGEEGRPGGAWFHHAKRGLLAPFAVGTVDQALMAAMNVKHGFVRAFGLAGKVVILDEVHSYDIYTGTILDALVTLLRELGCTVIILSATLAQARREQLIGTKVDRQDYPLISAIPRSAKILTEIPTVPPLPRRISLCLQQQDKVALDEALSRAELGQQVLWVENTVADAQTIYQTLAVHAAALGLECGLLHARFTHTHRQQNEDKWVGLFGKAGWPQRRLHGRILVGTQVLEQSLDIDADFLITRFAPTDMLLQRLGRLWRHDDTPRPFDTRPEAWLLTPVLPDAIANPQMAFGDSAAVYSPYVLCRSLQCWQSLTAITLPDDIRSLIEATYALKEETGDMARWLYELEHSTRRGTQRRLGRQDLQRLAQATLATTGNVESDVAVQTRYSEQDALDTLLLRGIRMIPGQPMTRLTLLDGSVVELPQRRHQLALADWRQLSICLQHELLSLRPNAAPPACDRQKLEALGLHHVFYLGDPEFEDALLRVALVDDLDGICTLDGQAFPGVRQYRYRDDLGYQRIT